MVDLWRLLNILCPDKKDKTTGKQEILVRFFHGRFNQRGKTNLYGHSDDWDQDRLIAKSKPILLDLDNYSEGKSTIKGYLIKDTYSFPKTKVDHGQYQIIVESPIIRDDSDLSRHQNAIKGIAQRLTILSKCIVGEALNTSPWETDVFTKKIELIGQMPLGWESNYELVQKELDKKKRLTMHVEVEPQHFYNLPASPFNDYLAAFKAFPRLKTIERDLLQILRSCLNLSKKIR